MKTIFLICLLSIGLCCLGMAGLAQSSRRAAPMTGSVRLELDQNIPQLDFAAREIRRALTDVPARDKTVIVLAAGAGARETAAKWQAPALASTEAQAYAIRWRAEGGQSIYVVLGADAVGAMYGGLDIAEAIRTGALGALRDSEHKPHIAQRGIKFNIPLDLRTPTYNGVSDSAQDNIAEMWSMDFWREFLDDMARHRYNVLSLWSLNPFPSIVNVPEFPHVALDDVWRTNTRFDEKFNGAGNGSARPEILATRAIVRKMPMAEKIRFWRAVMQLARDRGVDVYWFTWNAFLNAVEGRDSVTSDKGGARTIQYFRASVRETIKTYPLLAGFGITAGESMEEIGTTKEKWLWQTYGEGIRDALRLEPKRKFRLIHRFHQTGLAEIQSEFAQLPCTLDLSFKYAVAHMYSVPRPRMIDPLLPLLGPRLRSWLTVRNDDIYSFRWADYDYARAFIRAMPGADKIAGFYMGPDGYVWGRDFLTKDPGGPRQTVMQKQWLSFALWGRLAYEPDLPAETFQRLMAARFPGADIPGLSAAWTAASRTFPYITRFFWGDIDVRWFPEACLSNPSYKGYYTVRHFIEGGTMPGAGVRNILDWRAGTLAGKMPEGVTPLEIAATLESNAANALAALPNLRRATGKNAREYTATLGDIEAMAQLGHYYAAKIRGACALALFDKTGDARQQATAVQHLEAALGHWKQYAAAYTRQYVQPVRYNRVGLVDIPALIDKAATDVQMARDWKPGTIDESQIRRGGTEAGFRN
ncbi:MAG: carbohydrate-binding family 6 protein [Blastocatellia bacterium]